MVPLHAALPLHDVLARLEREAERLRIARMTPAEAVFSPTRFGLWRYVVE